MTEMDAIDWANRIRYHAPRWESTVEAHEAVRKIIEETGLELAKFVNPGREFSLMLTKLEEAQMWAHASIARND